MSHLQSRGTTHFPASIASKYLSVLAQVPAPFTEVTRCVTGNTIYGHKSSKINSTKGKKGYFYIAQWVAPAIAEQAVPKWEAADRILSMYIFL